MPKSTPRPRYKCRIEIVMHGQEDTFIFRMINDPPQQLLLKLDRLEYQMKPITLESYHVTT